MRVTPCSRACANKRLLVGPGRQAHELERARGAGDDVERLRPDGPGRAQDAEPLHGDPLWQRPLRDG